MQEQSMDPSEVVELANATYDALPGIAERFFAHASSQQPIPDDANRDAFFAVVFACAAVGFDFCADFATTHRIRYRDQDEDFLMDFEVKEMVRLTQGDRVTFDLNRGMLQGDAGQFVRIARRVLALDPSQFGPVEGVARTI